MRPHHLVLWALRRRVGHAAQSEKVATEHLMWKSHVQQRWQKQPSQHQRLFDVPVRSSEHWNIKLWQRAPSSLGCFDRFTRCRVPSTPREEQGCNWSKPGKTQLGESKRPDALTHEHTPSGKQTIVSIGQQYKSRTVETSGSSSPVQTKEMWPSRWNRLGALLQFTVKLFQLLPWGKGAQVSRASVLQSVFNY